MAEQSAARRPGSGPPGSSIFDQAGFDQTRARRRGPDHPQSWGEVSATDTDWPGEDEDDDVHAPYRDWRARTMAECDRDYAAFREEKQRQFEADFQDWRRRRRAARPEKGPAGPGAGGSDAPAAASARPAPDPAPSDDGARRPGSARSRGSRTRS